jgi:hypothetical protein
VLRKLHENGILDKIIFIGSWCIHFYRWKYDEAKNLSEIKTRDIDIDVSPLLKIKAAVDIPTLLEPLDFEMKFAGDNFTFLIHPALKIDFLSPEIGKSREGPLKLPGFGITAQLIRFLDLLEREIITIDYKGLRVNVPHPVWFGIHKLIISQRRQNKWHDEKMNVEGKSHKDARQAIEVLLMVCKMGQGDKILNAIETLSKKERKLIRQTADEHRDYIELTAMEIYDILF